MGFRTGFGFDVHRLVPDRELWLGGIRIEHSLGLLGHSDADVLIHAIADALLGAANMRDIGYHFPDTSDATEGMDSKIILKEVTRPPPRSASASQDERRALPPTPPFSFIGHQNNLSRFIENAKAL